MKKVTACPLYGEQEVFDACRFNTGTIEMTAPTLTAAQEQRIAEIAFEHYHYVYRTTLEDIEQAIRAALADQLLVPQFERVGMIYHAMANDGKCAPVMWNQSPASIADGTVLYIPSPPQVSDD